MTRAFENEPAVSVVVPLYNVPEKYFTDCIAHLRAQTLEKIEIIVVDDGSTSGVEKLADEFAAQDTRICVFHRENGGVSAARNFGILQARGKYISFLDADDWIDEDILRMAFDRAEKDELDIVCWGVVREYKNRSVRFDTPSYIRVNTVYEGKTCEELRLATMDLATSLPAPFGKIVRRACLTDNELYFDEELKNYAEDLEWNFRLFGAVRRAVILSEYAHHYVCNPESLTSRITAENAASSVVCIKKMRAAIAGLPNEERFLKALDYRYLFMLSAIAISGFFHPCNKAKYRDKKKQFKAFVAQEEVKETLRSPSRKALSFARRTVIFCMRHRWCLALRILAFVRYREKRAV